MADADFEYHLLNLCNQRYGVWDAYQRFTRIMMRINQIITEAGNRGEVLTKSQALDILIVRTRINLAVLNARYPD